VITITDVSRDLSQTERLHAFLLPHFGAEELEPLSYFTDQIAAGGPVESILLLGEEDGQVVCGAVTDLLHMGGDRALGAFGHALVDPSVRGRGVGRLVSEAADAAMAGYAAQRGWTIEAHILESEDAAGRFWSRLGYRWPEGMRYWQPPLGYHPDGTPALPKVPLLLMVRHAEHAGQIPAALLEEYTRTLLWQWYRDELPEQLPDPGARQRATHWFDNQIVAPCLRSIEGDPVTLISLLEADPA